MGRQQALLQCGAEEADAQRLAKDQLVAGPGAGVPFEVVRVDQTDGDETLDRLDRVDRVPSGNRDPRLAANRFAALENALDRWQW